MSGLWFHPKESSMSKPHDFENTRIAVRNIPYLFQTSDCKGDPAHGGVLGKGHVLWIRSSMGPDNLPVSVYAEGIGLVELDSHCLFLSN